MSEFFYRDSDEVVGPISGATLKSLCQRGAISPKTEIRKDDGPWKPAGQVKGLAELFTLETARVVMVNHRSPTSREENGKPAVPIDEPQRPRLAPGLPGEIVLLRGRPQFFQGLPFLSTKVAALLLPLLAIAAITQSNYAFLILLGGIAAIAFAWLVFAFMCVRGMAYEVTTERIIFVSRPLERLRFNLRHDDLVDVSIKQNWLQRLLGTGDLQLRTEHDPTVNHIIPNLARPRLMADEIEKRMVL